MLDSNNLYLIKNQDEVDTLFNTFFDYIKLLTPIPASDQAYCRQLFTPIYASKNTLLERQDTVHKYHNFIVYGFIRNFYIDHDGNEITTDINDRPRFFTSYNHFIHQTVANENLHCITDCKLLRISIEDVLKAKTIGITSQEYSEKILQFYLESSKQRINDLINLTAKERYIKLLRNQPSILQNVPLIYIASFLGINPGSLSRIRQELSLPFSSQM